jgi:molybdopterin molybdotransferase
VITVAEARRFVLSGLKKPAPRRFQISEICGLVLAETIVAAESVPRFPNSAMDGYAIRAADTEPAPVCLSVIGAVVAGDSHTVHVRRGAAVRIMTGAPLPLGADAVCPVELTRLVDAGRGIMVAAPLQSGSNVRTPGEDIAAGSTVFAGGTQLGPCHIGVLASLGVATVLAHPRPTVGVLSTGDELTTAGTPPGPGKIRDANRPALLAQLGRDGFRTIDLGIIADDETMMADMLRTASRTCDVIVATGGVSVGERDVLKVVLEQLGGSSTSSLDVAMKPGKHIAVAMLGPRQSLVLGLPGNPVAALVSYELIARPALRFLAGHQSLYRPRLAAIADTRLHRRPGPRLHFMRVTARVDADGRIRVQPSGNQESHMLRAMANANALALLPDGDGVSAGDNVEILLLDTDLG